MPRRRRFRLGLPACALAAVLLPAGVAHADPSGWIHTGGGLMAWESTAVDELTLSGTMTIEAGLGTSEDEPFIFGGVFRIQPVFDHGVDLALMGRFASQGFQQGVIGFAFDAGVMQRFWGVESTGFIGQGILGGPLGTQLAVMGSVGSAEARAFTVTLGIDFARLMIHRQHLLNWWPNPRATKAVEAASSSGAAWRF